MRLGELTTDSGYVTAAAGLLEHVKAAQFPDTDTPDIHGGLSGSLPIHAPYERYCLVSWGAKFLIDAIIMKERLGL